MKYNVIVVGAGFSGLVAAAKAAEMGKKVLIISKGQGDVNLTSGCIDILGCLPNSNRICSVHTDRNLQLLVEQFPEHPYAKVGLGAVQESINYFLQLTKELGYPYQGDMKTNYLLPTTFGTVRPTGLVPATMDKGDV